MTETPSGGPLVPRPTRRRNKLTRPTTHVADPSDLDLENLSRKVDALPQDLQTLAAHLAPRRLWRIEQALSNRTFSLSVLLHQVEDPHNQAAVFRTAEGLGLQEIHIVPHPYNPLRPSVGVTQNAHKWLDLVHHESFHEALPACRSRGHLVLAAALTSGSYPAAEVDWTRPITVVLGNEVHGIPDDLMAACDGVIALPMYGLTASYNLSVAAAMLLSAAVEARRRAWGRVGDLGDKEKARLRRRFYRLALPARVRHALDD